MFYCSVKSGTEKNLIKLSMTWGGSFYKIRLRLNSKTLILNKNYQNKLYTTAEMTKKINIKHI